MMTTEDMLKEICAVYPYIEMPAKNEILFQKEGAFVDEPLLEDIDEYRGKEITGVVIRLLHQELSVLSAKTWRWILPYYLKYCLTPEAEYNRMETEFLIYALSPSLEFELDTSSRMSLLNTTQIDCLAHFVDWCAQNSFWKEYCPEELQRSKSFLWGLSHKPPA